MKRIMSFIFTLLIFSVHISAQILNGDIDLRTQAQIDTFPYTQVTGTIMIYEETPGNITNLHGLSKLTSVSVLYIQANTSLKNLDGIENINPAPMLTRIDLNASLENVDAIAGWGSDIEGLGIAITGNNSLTDISGLSNIVHIPDLELFDNNNLENLDALSNLQTVTYSMNIGGTSLTDISGLSNLTSVDDWLSIRNSALKNLEGLSSLVHLRQLVIQDNPDLINLNGISGLTKLGSHGQGGLSILNNQSLQSLDGLENLSVIEGMGVGGLQIVGNQSLQDLDGLSNLADLSPAYIEIKNNTSLTRFCGLNLVLQGLVNPTVIIETNAVNPTVPEILEGGACTTRNSFVSVLKGANEIPVVETDMTGGAIFIANKGKDTLSYYLRLCNVSSDVLSVTLNAGAEGNTGTVVKTLAENPDTTFISGLWTSSDDEPLTENLFTELLNGNIYVNVLTSSFPDGEIRGQNTNNKTVNLYAELNGENEVPPITFPGTGIGNFLLARDGTQLNFDVSAENLTTRILSLTFHNAPEGFNGPVVRKIENPEKMNFTIKGVWGFNSSEPLTPALVADVLACNVYVNVNTSCYPYGEIRGQIMVDEMSNQQIATSVDDKTKIPAQYSLKQNYPNPFNPSTVIKYSLVEDVQVVIKIYDLLGSEIATLVNEPKSAGEYHIELNASNLPSGIYLYRMNAGKFTDTKKLCLVK